ncbi:MAG: trypsin-like peptidase domain-containing protein [Gammaproteobacteria bacterium]
MQLKPSAVLAAAVFFLSSLAAGAADNGDWRATLERVSPSIVSIQVDQTRAFDTEWNSSSQATGFVVDADAGLILTNRHVVTPGPVVAEAVFLNHEEVELTPVYRDPVHDFGFYRYDPARLRYIDPVTLPLAPEGAQVGREIRVVGNDAGEQISILAGTLARLDRGAPEYGRGQYNDFNTFYLQAASGTSGGSSGSPVIDIDGNVVALNAGANTQAASSFFLPLGRVTRALNLIREGRPVTRGTLLTTFVHVAYDELRRLGLSEEEEALYRAEFPGLKGMLVVREVLPGAPAEDRLAPGDILLTVNGQPVAEFDPLADILDEGVGETVNLSLRRGDEMLQVALPVTDLHRVTPDAFVQFGDAVVHDLSYQQARHLNVALGAGVYVANPGYVFSTAAIPRAAVVVEMDGEPTPDLETFVDVVSGLKDGDQVPVRWFGFDDPRTPRVRSLRMDRRWFPAQRCARDDSSGHWPCEALPEVGTAAPPEPASTRFPPESDRKLATLQRSLVLVNFDMPYPVSGVSDRNYHGTGLVMDAEQGLVVVDRNTVPEAMGDAVLTFAGSVEIPAEVAYIHPLHNLSVLRYDPALIGDTPVRSASIAPAPAMPGDRVWVVGLRGDHRLVSQSTEVASVDALTFPLSRTLRFRESNLESIQLVNGPSDFDGVLADEKGRVLGMWSSFAFDAGRTTEQSNEGMPGYLVAEVAELARGDRELRSLESELSELPLASARRLGLSEEWVRRLEAHDPERRQALQVTRLVAGSPAASLLKPGDVLLSVNDNVVSRFREVEVAAQVPVARVVVWREGEALSLEVPTVQLDGSGVDRVVQWAGALLQAPHRPMAAQRGIEPSGVFVAYYAFGSPASRYGLFAGQRVVEVDGVPTPDLDAFLAEISGRPDRSAVRLKTVAWNGQEDVITLKLDNRYWPAYELVRGSRGWRRTPIPSPVPGEGESLPPFPAAAR